MSADPLKNAVQNLQDSLHKRESAKIYQLPIWPEPDRGVPNEFSRSALFAAIQAKSRTYLENQEIASQEGCTILFTGQRLDQTHLDVFEGIMHIARGVHEGNQIRFTAHRLLRLIGRDTGNTQHKWLYRTLQQLTATSVAIVKDGKRVFWGSLLPKGAEDFDSGEYVVEISRDLAKLFNRGFTQIDWEQRRKLRRKPLAQWLQIYYSSHAKPFPVTVEFIRHKSGSSTKSLRKFRQLLKAALNEIKAVDVISDWSLDDHDKVHVARNPSPSQRKYLSRTESNR
jgi:hypothetical protein